MPPNTLDRRLELRVSTEQVAELEAIAHVRHQSVSDVIRERIDLGASLERRFDELRRELFSVPARVNSPNQTPGNAALGTLPDGAAVTGPMLVEMLLLLRAMARPQHLHDAQGAVDRLGMTLWTAEERR